MELFVLHFTFLAVSLSLSLSTSLLSTLTTGSLKAIMSKEAPQDIKKKLKGCQLTKILPLCPKKNKKEVDSDEGESQETREGITKVNDAHTSYLPPMGYSQYPSMGYADYPSHNSQLPVIGYPQHPPMGYAQYPPDDSSMGYAEYQRDNSEYGPTGGLAPPPPPPQPEHWTNNFNDDNANNCSTM